MLCEHCYAPIAADEPVVRRFGPDGRVFRFQHPIGVPGCEPPRPAARPVRQPAPRPTRD